MVVKITSSEIVELLNQKYPPPQWAFFEELRVGTGYKNRKEGKNPEQRMDAWAINCYPSKQFATIAFEVKVSRSDYLHEIANPDKRKQAIQLSNEFYFVVPSGLVSAEEVPGECGLMVVCDKVIKVIKKPVINPDPLLDWQFVASIARRGGQASERDYNQIVADKMRYLRRLEEKERELKKLSREHMALLNKYPDEF